MDWENEILMSCAPKWANHAPVDEIPVIKQYKFTLKKIRTDLIKALYG